MESVATLPWHVQKGSEDDSVQSSGEVSTVSNDVLEREEQTVSRNILCFVVMLASCNSLLLTRVVEAEELTDEQMQACWDDLLKLDPEASRALLKLSASPERTVAFLKSRLQPLRVDAEQVNKWIKDLESDDDEVWKPAYEKLRYFDPRLAIDLPTLMADVSDHKSRPRLVEILSDRPEGSMAGKDVGYREFEDGQNFLVGNGSFWAEKGVSRLGSLQPKREWTRAVRAIVLLEHIASDEAVAILKDMATGNPDAGPTNVAATALEKRQGKR